MSRQDNLVRITGKVVKGPIVRYTDTGKCRCFYQIEVAPRNKDNGAVAVPFVRSVGNQAEKDRDNIKIGDLVTVAGRINTREETKKMYFVCDKEHPNKLITINPDDEECPMYNDDEIFEAVVTRPVTEIFAEDVMYFHEYLSHIEASEQLKLFTPQVLKKVMFEYEQNGGNFPDLVEQYVKESNSKES